VRLIVGSERRESLLPARDYETGALIDWDKQLVLNGKR
jgi:hypothetical protein